MINFSIGTKIILMNMLSLQENQKFIGKTAIIKGITPAFFSGEAVKEQSKEIIVTPKNKKISKEIIATPKRDYLNDSIEIEIHSLGDFFILRKNLNFQRELNSEEYGISEESVTKKTLRKKSL